MKRELIENKGIPASLLWILAIIAGISVANLYYNQPLLNRISEDFGISEFTANLIPMTTQIGYALGLLFIIPLGDLYNRRNIILIKLLHAGGFTASDCRCAQYLLCTGSFAFHGNLFGDASDIYSHRSPVFYSGNERKTCGYDCCRTADR